MLAESPGNGEIPSWKRKPSSRTQIPENQNVPFWLYSYSVVGLLMAVTAMLTATRWRLPGLYRAGLGLLAGVTAKIFLIDMSGLQGLWRVASFMGLGPSLLGLAWLHQRMQAGDRNAAET